MHPLRGRKQTPEQIAKRVAAVASTKAAWSEERRTCVSKNVSAANTRRGAGERLSAHRFDKGLIPWNKGNRWTDGLSPEAVRAVRADRARRRRAKSAKARIHGRVSALVRFSLKRVGAVKARVSWTDLVGYTADELVTHLKTTIPPGYEWRDYLDGRLELDHKVPVSVHNFASATDPDFRRCWALSNLQLLPAQVNFDKRAKLSAPFQPSLSFS